METLSGSLFGGAIGLICAMVGTEIIARRIERRGNLTFWYILAAHSVSLMVFFAIIALGTWVGWLK